MKSYNGVAILSKVPFTTTDIHHRCGKEDCRHVEAALDVGGDPILLDNLYIPAGGDIPDPKQNEKFAHKLAFYREMAHWYAEHRPKPRATKGRRRIAVGDLNVAPLEHARGFRSRRRLSRRCGRPAGAPIAGARDPAPAPAGAAAG